jgi:hypothetical protein
VVIPEGVLEIAEDAFYYQEGLTGSGFPPPSKKSEKVLFTTASASQRWIFLRV